MVTCPTIQKDVIRRHYDVSTLFYRLLWGPHIHHGYWEADESPKLAQDQLTDRLFSAAGIADHARVADIGCGMGGSSRRLAKLHGCCVTGVTISPFQQRWASLASMRHGLRGKLKFVRADAEQVELPDQGFDAVWSVECTEHLFDKPAFFKRAAQWLKPSGVVAICAWLAGPDLDEEKTQQVYDVCEGMFCPSLGDMQDYQKWMQDAGLRVEKAEDWTRNVDRTWEVCGDRVKRFSMHRAARLIDRGQIIFLDRFQAILDAYRSGAMQYGCFVARKEPQPSSETAET